MEYTCHLCGKPLSRNHSQQKQSKSGLFFCSRICKNLGRNLIKNLEFSVTEENPISQSVKKVYLPSIDRSPEYLIGIWLHKMSQNYSNLDGTYFVTSIAKENNNSQLAGRTPHDIFYIRTCFDNIKESDILSLPNITQEWEKIKLKYWDANNITYILESEYSTIHSVQISERVNRAKELINNGYGFKCCKRGFWTGSIDKTKTEHVWNGHPVHDNGEQAYDINKDMFCSFCGKELE